MSNMDAADSRLHPGARRLIEPLEVKAELTTQEAADYLNVSRPLVVKLINSGALLARIVGTQELGI